MFASNYLTHVLSFVLLFTILQKGGKLENKNNQKKGG